MALHILPLLIQVLQLLAAHQPPIAFGCMCAFLYAGYLFNQGIHEMRPALAPILIQSLSILVESSGQQRLIVKSSCVNWSR